VGKGLLIIEDARSQSDTPKSVGLLWTSDQSDAQTSTTQYVRQQTEIRIPEGVRTRSLNMRASADQDLRRRRHWGRPSVT